MTVLLVLMALADALALRGRRGRDPVELPTAIVEPARAARLTRPTAQQTRPPRGRPHSHATPSPRRSPTIEPTHGRRLTVHTTTQARRRTIATIRHELSIRALDSSLVSDGTNGEEKPHARWFHQR